MGLPADVDSIIDATAKALRGDLSRHTTCTQLADLLTVWKRDFHDPSTNKWRYQDASKVATHFEGEWLEGGAGNTSKIARRASSKATRAATRWRAASPQGLSLDMFLDMDEWLEVLCALVPHTGATPPGTSARHRHQPTCRCRECVSAKKVARAARKGALGAHARDADDYGSSADSEDSAEEEADDEEVHAAIASEPMQEDDDDCLLVLIQ